MMRKSKLLFLVLLCFAAINVRAQAKLPIVIEIVYPGGNAEYDKLISFCGSQQFIDANDIYSWKNHFVIYGKGYERFYPKVKAAFKDCKVKLYDKPFYDFERTKCSDKTVAKQWDNIILTANLVKSPKLQQEYLNYHKTQFEKWPEVSQGFCNASFQQLLVFRNGRQLMLIISIPKGESLDKLNPLTTKNNPRVDEWNKIMAKYQEGIEGTAKNETWVFLKPYNQTDHINHK
ncbi:L-rhamnose mutarotase [Mucilaginibacter sp. HMF5004]|uniref:L-rhamnose mutarotase n=1 Tax=Mucilaginibacter rivuli TaxID=2857527 RepID=UPI001C5CEE7F|nr:L-rhamnose mutarotase [Mucilaginibacter rivuli]MBW4889033.1 L-rhamnose mutarotase [Mucilaginibacter rivuli]